MRSTRLMALGLTAALGLAACGSGGGSGSDDSGPITIGMVAPLTGPLAPLGIGDKAAAEQEVAAINKAGGIDGRKIKLIIVDDKSDVPQSVTEYSKMAANRDISLVLSSANVSASTAIGPTAQSRKVPTLALGPVTAFVDGKNPYAFTIPASPKAYAEKLVDYFVDQGVKTLSVAYNGKDVYGPTGNDATKAAAKAAGIDVVMDESFDPAATDFTPLITKAKNAKADAFLVWGAGPAPVIIAKQLQGTGIKMTATGANASNLFTEPAGDAAEGMVMASSIAVPGKDIPAGPLKSLIDEFAGPWEKANKGIFPPQFAFDGATGIQIAKAAIEKAGSSDREVIRDALEGLDVLTPTGRFQYSKTDHSGLDKSAVAIVEVKDGAFTATEFSRKQFETELPK